MSGISERFSENGSDTTIGGVRTPVWVPAFLILRPIRRSSNQTAIAPPDGKRIAIAVTPILGGLHHEYRLEATAA